MPSRRQTCRLKRHGEIIVHLAFQFRYGIGFGDADLQDGKVTCTIYEVLQKCPYISEEIATRNREILQISLGLLLLIWLFYVTVFKFNSRTPNAKI